MVEHEKCYNFFVFIVTLLPLLFHCTVLGRVGTCASLWRGSFVDHFNFLKQHYREKKR